MLSKEEFVEVVDTIKDVDDFYDGIYNVQKTHGVAGMDSYDEMNCRLSSALASVLENMFEDSEGYLEWWLWETEYGNESAWVSFEDENTGEDKIIVLDTAEKLYGFLIENM